MYLYLTISIIVVCATIIVKNYVCMHLWIYNGKVKTCSKCGKKEETQCFHEWETLEVAELPETKKHYETKIYIQQCKTCGEIKKDRIIIG